MKLKQKILGVYEFGYEQVQIVLREGTGAEFYFMPEKGSVPRIKIGCDYKEWRCIITILQHEALEFALTRLMCRYECAEDMSKDHSAYLFVMTHQQMSDACAKVADLMSNCLPDLAEAWKKWNKKGKMK